MIRLIQLKPNNDHTAFKGGDNKPGLFYKNIIYYKMKKIIPS